MKNQFPISRYSESRTSSADQAIYEGTWLPKGEEGVRVAKELWELPEREFAYTAITGAVAS